MASATRTNITRLEASAMLGRLSNGLGQGEEAVGKLMDRMMMDQDADTLRHLLLEEGAKSLLERRRIGEMLKRGRG